MNPKINKQKFSFWQPGGITGHIEAISPFEAAQVILSTDTPSFVNGDVYSQPWHYTNGETDCKIWKIRVMEL